MTEYRSNHLEQFAGWLSLLAVGLFLIFSHVNTLDNIEHLNLTHHDQHSFLSITAHDDGGMDHDDGGLANDDASHHSHPNVFGTVLASAPLSDQALQYSSPAIHAWVQFNGLTDNPAKAHERPPKRA